MEVSVRAQMSAPAQLSIKAVNVNKVSNYKSRSLYIMHLQEEHAYT